MYVPLPSLYVMLCQLGLFGLSPATPPRASSVDCFVYFPGFAMLCFWLRAPSPAARGRWSMVVRSRSSRPINRLSIEEALGLRDDPGVEFVAVGLVRARCRLQSLHEVVLLQVIDVVDADVDVRRVERFFDRALVRAHLRFAHGRGGRGHELDEYVLWSL